MSPIDCSCEKCRRMCATSTCLPTPEGARALIRAGFADRLSTYRIAPDPETFAFVGPSPAGQEGERDLPHTKAACTFFRDGLCELHAAGLKPLEGKIAHHERDWRTVRLYVTDQWIGKRFDSVLSMLDRTLASRPHQEPSSTLGSD